jgi:hypothetical protein
LRRALILETRMSAEYLKSGSNDARVTLCERKHFQVIIAR